MSVDSYFLRKFKKRPFLFYRSNHFFLIFQKKEDWTDVYFHIVYHFPKFQRKIFLIVDKKPEKLI